MSVVLRQTMQPGNSITKALVKVGIVEETSHVWLSPLATLVDDKVYRSISVAWIAAKHN